VISGGPAVQDLRAFGLTRSDDSETWRLASQQAAGRFDRITSRLKLCQWRHASWELWNRGPGQPERLLQLNGSWIHRGLCRIRGWLAIDKASSRGYCIQDPTALCSMGSTAVTSKRGRSLGMVLRRGCLAAAVARGELLFVLMATRIWVRPHGIGKRPGGRCSSWLLAGEY
jgi:hypothetical protein